MRMSSAALPVDPQGYVALSEKHSNRMLTCFASMLRQLWGLLWTLTSFVFLALAVLGGILAVSCTTCSRHSILSRLTLLRTSPLQFHRNLRQQIREGQRFLPT